MELSTALQIIGLTCSACGVYASWKFPFPTGFLLCILGFALTILAIAV